MGKGYINGETCSDAIKACFAGGQTDLSYTHIITVVTTRGPWTDATIRRNLMGSVINLIPARYEWPSMENFLFLRPDGRYELYNKITHPSPVP